jgi:hypothetical protein
MKIILPIKLSNSNSGRGNHWGASASFRKKVEKKLRGLGLARSPFTMPVTVTVTRILGKGERLWDSSSILRGNYKEIEDALVAIGWFVDDSTEYIHTTDGRQDDTRRNKGPAIELEILPYYKD